MKKAIAIFMTVCMLASLFVSCDISKVEDQLVTVSFGTGETKSLTSSLSVAAVEDLVWWYKANPTDQNATFDYGKTGETWTKLGSDGKITNVITLSRGKWNFDLAGMIDANAPGTTEAKMVYSGSASSVLIGDSSEVWTVNVDVSTSAEGKGELVIPESIVINQKTSSGYSGTNVKANYYRYKSVSDSTYGSYTLIPSTGETLTVAAGQYTIELSNRTNAGTPEAPNWYTNAVEEITVNVFSCTTTTVGGSINENTQAVQFNAISQYKSETTKTVTSGTDAATIESISTPSMSTESSKKTTVTVPASVLGTTSEAKDVKMVVEVTPVVASTTEGFSIQATDNNKVVAAAIDLTLKTSSDNGSTWSDVSYTSNTDAITVETYIAKGLKDVDVKFVGEGAQPTDISYIEETGKLVFKTTHFSTFAVESSSVALAGDTAYVSLADAIAAAQNGQTVTLLKDISTNEGGKYIHLAQNLDLNLNGHTISNYIVYICDKAKISISNGKIDNSFSYGVFAQSAVDITLTDVDVTGNGYALASYGATDGYKLTINSGTFTGYVGTSGNDSGNTVVINGGTFKDGCYFPAGGTYTINGGAFKATDCASLYWKSGNPLTINGGTFKTTLTKDFKNQWAHYNNGSVDTIPAAIVIEACNYGGHGQPSVTIGQNVQFETSKDSDCPYTGEFFNVLAINYKNAEDAKVNKGDYSKIGVEYYLADNIAGHVTSDGETAPSDGWLSFTTGDGGNTEKVSPSAN